MNANPSVFYAPQTFKSKGREVDIDQLLQRVLQRDDYAAFEYLFTKNYQLLCSFCKKLTQSAEVAEELVSEVFFKIWANRKRIKITSSGKSYLYTAVRNISFDYLRQEKRSLWTDIDLATSCCTEAPDPHHSYELEELQDRINIAIAKLPKQCRLIFQLSRDHGLRYHEIADHLNVSVKTVETQMGRALKYLKKYLQNELIL